MSEKTNFVEHDENRKGIVAMTLDPEKCAKKSDAEVLRAVQTMEVLIYNTKSYLSILNHAETMADITPEDLAHCKELIIKIINDLDKYTNFYNDLLVLKAERGL